MSDAGVSWGERHPGSRRERGRTSLVRAAGQDGRERAKGKRKGLASGRTEGTRVLGGQSQRVCLEPGHRNVGAGEAVSCLERLSSGRTH